MKAGLLVVALLLGAVLVNASAGTNEGEVVLDEANNYANTNILDRTIIATGSAVSSELDVVATTTSTAKNDLEKQLLSKENAQNPNVELEAAKANFEQSKENTTTMFFYIVATLTILFDALASIVYIALLALVIWFVFVGYAKFLIFLIDVIYDKYKLLGAKH